MSGNKPKYSIMYGYRRKSGWWVVLCEDGEPWYAVHPETEAAERAHRDSFSHWTTEMPDVLRGI